eukprot:5999255-Pyramimonas_sp.AAC.1
MLEPSRSRSEVMHRGPKNLHRASSIDDCGWKIQDSTRDGASRVDDRGARIEDRGLSITGRRSRNEHRRSSNEGRIPPAL